MQSKFILLFLRSAGVLLLIAALAKLVSSLASARFLDSPDPLLSISFRQVFRIAGAAELAIALICLFSKSINLRAVFVAWLATSFLIYRFGLWWIHYQKPCNCLGNLT